MQMRRLVSQAVRSLTEGRRAWDIGFACNSPKPLSCIKPTAKKGSFLNLDTSYHAGRLSSYPGYLCF